MTGTYAGLTLGGYSKSPRGGVGQHLTPPTLVNLADLQLLQRCSPGRLDTDFERLFTQCREGMKTKYIKKKNKIKKKYNNGLIVFSRLISQR